MILWLRSIWGNRVKLRFCMRELFDFQPSMLVYTLKTSLQLYIIPLPGWVSVTCWDLPQNSGCWAFACPLCWPWEHNWIWPVTCRSWFSGGEERWRVMLWAWERAIKHYITFYYPHPFLTKCMGLHNNSHRYYIYKCPFWSFLMCTERSGSLAWGQD